jgi:hypothetical protein
MPAARFMPHVVRGACTNLFAETKGDKRWRPITCVLYGQHEMIPLKTLRLYRTCWHGV